MHTYGIEVVRNPKAPYSAGELYFYKNDEIIFTSPVHTGPQQPKDATLYGGCTPPIEWRCTESIASRRGLVNARIEPTEGQDLERYRRRTFDLILPDGRDRQDPFMLHIAGRSTGCIALPRRYWNAFVPLFNECLDEQGEILILVLDEDMVVEEFVPDLD